MVRHFGRFSLLILPIFLFSCTSTPVPNSRLESFVEEMLFIGNYDPKYKKTGKLSKWETDIRYYLEGEDISKHQDLIERRVSELAGFANLDSTRVKTEQSANIVIKLTHDEFFSVNRELAGCYVSIKRKNSKITNARIFIGLKKPENLDSCISHEMMHALGFGFHSGVINSVMSPFHKAETYTTYDVWAITVLYDPSLKAGDTQEEAMPKIRQILERRSFK